MAYEVLARKWRPKNFSELIGQPAVRQTLVNALKSRRLYPVLLFTGPRGTGKTSTARILAKSLRCQSQKEGIPCDQCEDCHFIQNSRHLDVIEIDGASNNSVDDVRELRGAVSYMPSTGLWKIYIIDEAHMLSNSAFNALLKTFEEPPDHVLFIMATTEIRKIPATILSRSQKLDFHLISPRLIQKQLESICKKEKLSVSEEVLWMAAKQARGSLRDGQSLLDQIITFCGEEASAERAAELLGLSAPHILFQCLQALIHRQEGQMIEAIESLRIKGNEPRLFLQSLIEAVARFLFLKKNPENKPELVQASREAIERMKKEAEGISYEDLHFLFDMLLKGEKDMALCHDSQLALEVLLLRLCAAPRLEDIVPLAGKEGGGAENKPAQKKTAPSGRSALSAGAGAKNPSSSSPPPPAGPPAPSSPAKSPDGKAFGQRFEFIEFLRKKDPALTAHVENLTLKRKSGRHFYFTAPEKFSYLKNKVMEPSFRKLLEEYLTEFLNSGEKAEVEIVNGQAQGPSLREEKKIREEDETRSQIQKNPFVNDVKEIFNGEIQSVVKDSK